MGKESGCIQDRRDGRKERLAGSGGAHRPDQAKTKGDPFKRLSMPCRDADGGMDQLMREDGRDLRRHRVGHVRQVRADEDFKMSVRAKPVVPALADRLALAARAGEADRDDPRAKTACGLGRSLQAEIEPCPKGRAHMSF